MSVAQDNADVIYLNHNSNKIYRTLDGGNSWERVLLSLPDSEACQELFILPKNDQEFLCPTESGKMYQSINGGKNGSFIRDFTASFPDVTGFEPDKNLVLDWDILHSKKGKIIYFTLNHQLIKSIENQNKWTDSVVEWSQFGAGNLVDIVVDPRNPQVVFIIGIENQSTSVYKSKDGGGSWQKQIGVINSTDQLMMHPLNSDKLIFIDFSTVSITGDGGNSWEELDYQTIGNSIYSIVFNPRNRDGFFIQTEKGIFESKDLGQHFNQIETELAHIDQKLHLFGFGDEVYLASPSQVYKLTASAISNETKNCVFNWAEQQYPTLFGLTIGESNQNEQYTYRYYSDTQSYLGFFQDKKVHYLNKKQSNNIEDVGYFEYYQHLAGCD